MRKIRNVLADYQKSGFMIVKGGKGSHRKLRHPSGVTVILSGKPKDDALPYIEDQLQQNLLKVENKKFK